VNHNLGKLSETEPPHPDQDRVSRADWGCHVSDGLHTSDIAHGVSVLSRFVAPGRHGAAHKKAALRLLGYLKGTAHYKLTLRGPIAALTAQT